MFVLDSLKVFDALVFPYLVVILYFNELHFFRFITKQSLCQCRSVFACAKVITYF